MEAMQEQEILQAFLKLMEENSRKEQAQDLTLLLSYLRDMEHQLDAVVNELHTVKRELAEQKAGLNPAGRREVSAKVKQLEGSAYHLFEQIEKLRNQIVTCAANALDSVSRPEPWRWTGPYLRWGSERRWPQSKDRQASQWQIPKGTLRG